MVARCLVALLAVVTFAAPALAQEPAGVGPPARGPITRLFDPPKTRFGPGHRGVDIKAAPGSAVRSAIGGIVSFSGEVANVGWVTVDHGGGLNTTYGPLATRRVRRAQRVRPGQVLGLLGPDADHLDWGARRAGDYIDPLSLLVEWEVTLVHPDDPVPDLAALTAEGAGGAGGFLVPVQGPVTSGFGTRRHPVTGVTRLHAGLDLAAPAGTPVSAAADGVVVSAGAAGGYGQMVKLRHAGGIETRYAHLSSTAVGAGEQVTAGRVIGAVGSTGLSTGPHLHLEVRVRGAAVDPAPWLAG